MYDQLEPTIHRFHHLMPHRVREVLLVSSPYDAFILEEDGDLTERIFDEYNQLNLSAAPRVTHVNSRESALKAMCRRRFDLVLAMMRMGDSDVFEFGREVKQLYPGRPVVVLTFDSPDVENVTHFISSHSVDQAYLWNGNADILLAIIKYVEDSQNVDHDITTAGVKAIIVVEDSIRYYSSFLAMLYKELMAQSSSLYSEGVNQLAKMMRMRARPKILHAHNQEEAVALYNKYKENLIAVISDIDYHTNGRRDPEAGLQFINMIRQENYEMPVIIQSANTLLQGRAEALNAKFLDKNSPTLLYDIRNFLQVELGFGDFIFRMEDGTEVGRARDMRELEETLKTIPEESLRYHALSDHISLWLNARGEFAMAKKLKPKKVSDFESMGDVREFLIQLLRKERKGRNRGVIAEYRRRRFEPENRMLRIGDGSIGGKARGIAFVNTLLNLDELSEEFEELDISVPQTVVVATNLYDQFMDANNLRDCAHECMDDETVYSRFSAATLPEPLVEELRFILERVNRPLAIRSSSLLEDSQYQPFAGIYSTYMVPNNSPFIDERVDELCRAIKLVYASTYLQNAKAYIKNTARRVEEEKMAVVIQRLVGRYHSDRYYPSFAGVAQSYNYYPIGHQQADDGIVFLALGLGRMVVDGGQALRFSPRHPQSLPQFPTPHSMLENSQRQFFALDLNKRLGDIDTMEDSTVSLYDLDMAEKDGTLKAVGGVYDAANDTINDSLETPGPRLVTFNNILKYKAIPLAKALSRLLEIFRNGMGCQVEMEFACDMGDWGNTSIPYKDRVKPTLHILQLRPTSTEVYHERFDCDAFAKDDILCRSAKILGHGKMTEIEDILYVKPDAFDPAKSPEIAKEIGEVNKILVEKERRFLLVGPGRWGSSDHWLGIPVQWKQISGAKIIIEASPAGYNVDPSQGTHFFHNITSLRIGYLSIPPGATPTTNEEFVDWDWLHEQPAIDESTYLRHIRLKQPLTVMLDGQSGVGVIVKPGVEINLDE